ncbi:MAG TPA: hypothetical protein IGR64_06835 [Leptolyngbyaceae cyanobacterium M65_K2018_010]|nr:hypothetical protein [Leptolyngbyaceae cyanobacterium M65_K2018_010]
MIKRLTYPSLIGLTLVALASCGARAPADLGFSLRDRLRLLPGLAGLNPRTPIGAVSQSRRTSVYLEGQVKQHLPLVGQSLYLLEDESGAIWVVTQESPPELTEAVTIRALIHFKSILMRGQEVGEFYAEELERLPQE